MGNKVKIKNSELINSPVIVDSSIIVAGKGVRTIDDEYLQKIRVWLEELDPTEIFLSVPSGAAHDTNMIAQDLKNKLEGDGYSIVFSILGNMPYSDGDISLKNKGGTACIDIHN